MASEERIFFAGLGASLVCLALVLVLDRPALDDPPTRTRASSDLFSGMIVPAAAEPAMAAAPSDSIPQIQPAKDEQAEKQAEGENEQLQNETPKTKELKAEPRKKQPERRLKKKQAHRVRQRAPLQTPQEPAILAFRQR